MVAAKLEPEAVFAGDYRVVRPLDEGGMGAVYVVEQLSTGEHRALKVMQPHLVSDLRTRERFLQEAKVRARIKSEHVVKVIAAGVDQDTGTPWLAMELLDGETLEHMVRRRGRLPAADVCTVFEHIGHALASAHAVGVVHRDIKPENIFVATSQRADVPFTVKLLDFGIAKVVQGSIGGATTGSLVGSPLWMAPEQCNGGRIRAATDVWSLGLLAFWALTGGYYWKSARRAEMTLEALLTEILISTIESPSQRAARFGFTEALAPGFDPWFLRCLARAPEERFHDAAEAVCALVPVLSNGRIRPNFAPIVTPVPALESSGEVPQTLAPSQTPEVSTRDDMELLATVPRRPYTLPGKARSALVLGLVAIPVMFVGAFGATLVFERFHGRSPAPTLHTQLPASPDSGAPGLPGEAPGVSIRVDTQTHDASTTLTAHTPRVLGVSVPATRPGLQAHSVPRALGHTFQRRLDWDATCAAHRQRRAWVVSPYFTSHSESEAASRSSGCVDIVGGIGWCCP